MKNMTFKEIMAMDDGHTVEEVSGILTSVYDRREGKTGAKQWSFQDGQLKNDAGETLIVTFNNHPDMGPWKGEKITITSSQGKRGPKGIVFKIDTYKDKEGQLKNKQKIQANENAKIMAEGEQQANDESQQQPKQGSNPPTITQSPKPGETRYWVNPLDGSTDNPYLASAAQVQQLTDSNASFEVCEDGDNQWHHPSDLGFEPSDPVDPTPTQQATADQSSSPEEKSQLLAVKKRIAKTSMGLELCMESTIVMVNRLHRKHPELKLMNDDGSLDRLTLSDLKEMATTTMINAFWNEKAGDLKFFPLK